ncbi:MAG: DUF4105 domain-containing protein [Polyangia bacterium]|jgi:hypothetical protein|nr:DUF4105 domain-containing protein [Polyangia bacterium]
MRNLDPVRCPAMWLSSTFFPVLLVAAISGQAADPGIGQAPTDPRVELLTIGQSPEIYHRFGHAALCLVHRREPDNTRCFNYGTADFQSPPQTLGWAFLRGRARFWVSVQSYEIMLWAYKHDDRDIWIQRIPFTQAQVDRLGALLDHDALEENRYYIYHHFDDNCSTRLRDHLDTVSGGALRRGGDEPMGFTFRQIGRRGLADQTGILLASHFLLGRRMDRQVTRWQAMFHPDHLRAEVAKKLGAEPRQFYKRKGPALPTEGSQGLGWVVLAAFALALPILAVRLAERLRPLRLLGLYERLALALPALALTIIALGVGFVVVVGRMPEMRWNEALLVFWPTDLLLPILGLPARRRYSRIRLSALGLIALGLLTGLLRQPLGAPLLLPGLPIALAAFSWRPSSGAASAPGAQAGVPGDSDGGALPEAEVQSPGQSL